MEGAAVDLSLDLCTTIYVLRAVLRAMLFFWYS